MLNLAIKVLGLLYAPWFTLAYLLVEAQEESNTRYQWPDGSIHKKPWTVDDQQMQELADFHYKQRWKDEAIDMSAIDRINRHL
jgi:hypothetical protein